MIGDLSEQRLTGRKLKHLDERFALTFDANPAALAITRLADSTFLDVNKNFEALLGWTKDEIIGHTAFEFDVYPDTSARQKVVDQLQKTGSMRDFETQMRSKSGRMLDVLVSMERVDFANERCILSVFVDLTVRRRAQHALREREQELEYLANASVVLASSLDYEQTLRTVAELAVPHIVDWCAVHILHDDGTVRELAVTHSDPAKIEHARELQRRYPPDPGRESAIHSVVQSHQPMIYADITDEMLAASARDADHLDLMRELGFCSVIVVPLIARDRALGAITLVSAESGRRFGDRETALAQELARRAAVAVDNARLFTERIAAEEAVRSLNAELEQRVQERTVQLAAANAELEAFAHSVSHDLRAPLRSMDGFSKVLMERYAASVDESGQRYLRHIRDASQEMGDLIDALLRLARLSRNEMRWEDVNLSCIAHSVAAELMAQDSGRSVQFEIADEIVASGDAQLLRVLLENLFANAWKFSRDRSPATIEFGVTRTAGSDAYFVRDNGVGFDPRYSAKLFGPFQRLHSVKDFEGTGIGLATAQRVVHRHGGRVWADGTVGQGATFSFTLSQAVETSL